jgi:hypothetical protein
LDEQPRPGALAEGAPATPSGRDPDLVTLEGLESELADLDAELARVERADESLVGVADVDDAGTAPDPSRPERGVATPATD